MRTKVIGLISLIWVVVIDSAGWGIAFSVFAAMFLDRHTSILSSAVTPTTRYMLYESLLAIYSLFMFFFAPVLGGIADKYGRKPGLKISMLGLTAGFVLCAIGAYWSSIVFLFLGRIISGTTAGSLSIAQAAVVDISTPKTKSFYLSILMVANCLGFSLGPVIGGLLELSSSSPVGTTAFLTGAVISLIGFFAVSFFFKETYKPDVIAKKFDLVKDFLNIKIAFCKPILNNYLIALLFSMTGFGLFFSNIPIFLSREFSSTSSLIGIILSSEAVIFSIALIFSGKFIFNYFKKIHVVIAALLVQFVIYLVLMMVLNSVAANVLLFSLISSFAGVMYIGLLTLVSDATSNHWQGRIMGVVAALSSVTWGVGPLLSGGLNHYGAGAAFMCSAFFVVIGLLALWYLKAKSSLKAKMI